MKIAVTGANGHVGFNLCQRLLELGHHVNALSHTHNNAIKNLPVNLIKGDLLDRNSLNSFLRGMDVVFHLAAKISISGDPDGMVHRINTEGTQNLLESIIQFKVGKLIHFSSIHAFQQEPVTEFLDETRPLVEQGFAYDVSKAIGERYVLEFIQKGLNAVILCPTAIIGPADPQPSLVGKAVIQLYHQQIPTLIPGGYDWVDVRDVVEAAINAIELGRKGEKYLLSGHWHSLQEFSSIIGQVTGTKTIRTILPFWIAQIGLPFIHLYSRLTGNEPLYTKESLEILAKGNRHIFHQKAKHELHHQPRPLKSSVADLFKWFQLNGYIK
jgi:dihydroflavonol-4-reductase